jgi:hypothetical protein
MIVLQTYSLHVRVEQYNSETALSSSFAAEHTSPKLLNNGFTRAEVRKCCRGRSSAHGTDRATSFFLPPQLVDCTKVTNYFSYGEKHHIGT